MTTFANILGAVAGAIAGVPLIGWILAAVIGGPILAATASWHRVLKRGQLHGPTVAEIAAMPAVPVLRGRFTVEAVWNDVLAERHARADRLADEMRPDIMALDMIEAVFRDRLWGFSD
jgi:hypothetical protein